MAHSLNSHQTMGCRLFPFADVSLGFPLYGEERENQFSPIEQLPLLRLRSSALRSGGSSCRRDVERNWDRAEPQNGEVSITGKALRVTCAADVQHLSSKVFEFITQGISEPSSSTTGLSRTSTETPRQSDQDTATPVEVAIPVELLSNEVHRDFHAALLGYSA